MVSRHLTLAILTFTGLVAPAFAQQPANLLRNARFQDDWLTAFPELKNHNWNYSMESYNRRDYIPDAWDPRGSWEWLDADAPWGKRRLILRGPDVKLTQSVNWCGVHDQRPPYSGFPDAGGFPRLVTPTSKQPARLVRDLILRVRVKGTNVPANAGTIALAWTPAMKPIEVTAPWPAGTYESQTVEVTLPAAKWLDAVKAMADAPLPESVQVTLHYKAAAGQIELAEATLTAATTDAPNLLANGGFEELDGTGYPRDWSRPAKYRYFPPAYYYIFNTWHNAPFDNRGIVRSDSLLLVGGKRSLQMIVPPGDEVAVTSEPIALNQKEPRLIEASAWVKTDHLCMLQLDALDEFGQRLDCFNFIHKLPQSIGTDRWRLIRQVFRPREPLKSIRLQLCARGVNGYTLGGVAPQPQANVVGTIWWDNVTLREPEGTAAELTVRAVKVHAEPEPVPTKPYLVDIDLGDGLYGAHTLRCVLPKESDARSRFRWEYSKPNGVILQDRSRNRRPLPDGNVETELNCSIDSPETEGIDSFRGSLVLEYQNEKRLGETYIRLSPWTTPLVIALGSAYLRPEQKQIVRMNFGVTARSMERAVRVHLEVIRRGSGKSLQAIDLPATPAAILAQRAKIPFDLRDDFRNLLLADLNVSYLPVQPFNDPQRNWFVRATLVAKDGDVIATADSIPFCRLAPEPKQPPVQSVTIDNDNLLYVNGQPWMPWGQCYGHNPVYDGPADPGPGKYRDLHNPPAWNLYDRHGGILTRAMRDFNCRRLLPANQDLKPLQEAWEKDNLYASSAFWSGGWSLADFHKTGGGQPKTDAWLSAVRSAPMVVSVAPGIEEAFGYFTPATPAQISGLKDICDHIRKVSGKPVMVGHGGYWNRFEFEKVPFFDIYDPETEPLYPAPVHTDLMPLIKGKPKVAWLRPQMYEPVPYERWRYHVWVELMRGVRGWQIAHGPADPSLFRGLHGEMEFIKPAVYSKDKGPAVSVEPWIEHWSRRHAGKTTIVAATTHGLTLGNWRWATEPEASAKGGAKPLAHASGSDKPGRPRITGKPHGWRQEDNGYALDKPPYEGPSVHSVQWLPDARAWPKGSKLVQWVRVAQNEPRNLVLLAKADGRWTHAASWGTFDAAALHKDLAKAHWFLRAMYRHASGFIGWDDKLTAQALQFIPSKTTDMGKLPTPGEWVRLELPLDKIGATGKLLDGIGFLHEGGRIEWGRTTLVDADGKETIVWGDQIGLPAKELEKVRINVQGLKAGTKVRVAFEDREITAGDGHFLDDFRGQDLYQRHGGGPYTGYGDTPVAVRVYEIAGG